MSSSSQRMLHKWQELTKSGRRKKRSRWRRATTRPPPRADIITPGILRRGNSPLTKLIPRQSLCTFKDFWVNPLRPKPSAAFSPAAGGSPGCAAALVLSHFFPLLALLLPLFLFECTCREVRQRRVPSDSVAFIPVALPFPVRPRHC